MIPFPGIIIALLAVLFGLSLAGCSSKQVDRRFYDAVAMEYRVYVLDDPYLSEEQRERRIRTVDAWSMAVRRTETTYR